MPTSPENQSDRPCDLAVDVNNLDHALGPPDAPVTLVEYGDYECPNCLNAFPTVQQLIDRYGDRLRFVFRHFPLHSVHPRAGVAAQAAEAAAAQGKFWDMHEQLFKNQDRLGDVDFNHLALRIGLEPYKFNAEMNSGRIIRRVDQHLAGGKQSGVRKTPSFFINCRQHNAPADYDSLSAAIDDAMPR